MSYTRNITMWGNISKLTQFDIFIGLHKQSHHSDYNAILYMFCCLSPTDDISHFGSDLPLLLKLH